jgi:molybdopterin converting factor small subunit
MSAKIKIPKHLQIKTNGETIATVNGSDVHACIDELIRQYPDLEGEILDDQGMLLLKWMVYINSRITDASDELSNPVKEGDMIELLPVVSGG